MKPVVKQNLVVNLLAGFAVFVGTFVLVSSLLLGKEPYPKAILYPSQPSFPALILLASDSWPSTVAPLTRQVPRISTPSGTCSGVVIAEDTVLTAAHCVEDTARPSITVGSRHAEVLRLNRVLDIAVLKVKVKNQLVMPLAPVNPKLGSEVAAAGFLLGAEELHVQFGHVSAIHGERIVANVQVLPGDSGGPMIDTQGRLVGMIQAYYQGSSVTLGANVETIRDFAEDFLSASK
jgi:S1-C subfamily serine protease